MLTGYGVEAIVRNPDWIVLETASGAVHARFVVNCAGLHSDVIAKMADANLGLRIVPFRGEYYELVPSKHYLVKGLIYPVADPRFPFLGVHFTKRIGGGVEAGPNAVFSFKREGYNRASFDLGDTLSAGLFPGFWKMAARNWRSGVGEMYRSWSRRAFTRALQSSCPISRKVTFSPEGRVSGHRRWTLLENSWTIFISSVRTGSCMFATCRPRQQTASLVIGREIVSTLEESADLKKVQIAVGQAIQSGN